MENISELRDALQKIKSAHKITNTINHDLLKKIKNDNWVTVSGQRKITKIHNEYIYARYTNNDKKKLITVYIGKEIASLLEIKEDDRFNVLSSLTSPGYFLLQKNTNGVQGYKIQSTKKSHSKHFSFPIYINMDFPKSQSLPVEFDINQDFELIINLNKVIK